MKTINFKPRPLLVILLMVATTAGFSQKLTVWRGGTPGKPNDWFCAKNWSTGHIPDEFSDVVIPDVSTSTFASPVVRSGMVEINTLNVLSNGKLTLGRGVVLFVFEESIQAGAGRVAGEGRVFVMNSNRQLPAKDVVGGDAKSRDPKALEQHF